MKRLALFVFLFFYISVDAQLFVSSSLGLGFSKPVTDRFFNYSSIFMYSSVNAGYNINKISLRTGVETYTYNYTVNNQTGRADLLGFPVDIYLGNKMPVYMGLGYTFKTTNRTEGAINSFSLHSARLIMGLKFDFHSKWSTGLELTLFRDFAGNVSRDVLSMGQTFAINIRRVF